MLVSVILFSESNNFIKKIRLELSLNNSNSDNYEIFFIKTKFEKTIGTFLIEQKWVFEIFS